MHSLPQDLAADEVPQVAQRTDRLGWPAAALAILALSLLSWAVVGALVRLLFR